jgi:hypothetical protein
MKTTILLLLLCVPFLSPGQLVRHHPIASGTYLIPADTNSMIMSRYRGSFNGMDWTLDSSVLSYYGTNFNRQWFRTMKDSVVIDSIGGIMVGAVGDTVTFRYLWGVNRQVPEDSCADMQVTSLTVGNIIAGTKTIPPERFVWLKVTKKTGAPVSAAIFIDARRKSP